MTDSALTNIIAHALLELEKQGELVITAAGTLPLSEFIAKKVLEVVPSPDLTPADMSKIKGLLLHLPFVDQGFADDLPAVTGTDLKGFAAIAEKLPLPS